MPETTIRRIGARLVLVNFHASSQHAFQEVLRTLPGGAVSPPTPGQQRALSLPISIPILIALCAAGFAWETEAEKEFALRTLAQAIQDSHSLNRSHPDD
jgi:hypothetical protein